MAVQTVDFSLQDGSTIRVEIQDSGRAGLQPAGAAKIVDKASTTFEEALKKVRPVLTTIIANVAEATESIAEVSVKLGLKFSAEAGIILTSQALEANITVNAIWRRREQR